jgi:hypothetical protein
LLVATGDEQFEVTVRIQGGFMAALHHQQDNFAFFGQNRLARLAVLKSTYLRTWFHSGLVCGACHKSSQRDRPNQGRIAQCF